MLNALLLAGALLAGQDAERVVGVRAQGNTISAEADIVIVADHGMASTSRDRVVFIEDLVEAEAARGVGQYVILGAGVDTFAQRRPELASRLQVFEVDQPNPQAWKRQRLVQLGYGVPEHLRFVPVDFEAGEAWWDRLAAAGFDASRPAFVASTGVSMYLTREAVFATLQRIASLAPC